MSPAQFRENRRRLGLTQAQLGRIIDTDPRTVRRWEDDTGLRPPNPIACRVLDWMLHGWLPPEWPEHAEEVAPGSGANDGQGVSR